MASLGAERENISFVVGMEPYFVRRLGTKRTIPPTRSVKWL
jgi:hypothetical protein